MLPAASAGAKPQPAIGIGKFQGTMTDTTPSGSWKVTSMPPATGICRPKSRSGAPRVVVQAVADVAGLPARVADGVARRCATSSWASSSTCASTTAAKARSSRARSPGRDGAPGRERLLGALDRGVGLGARRRRDLASMACLGDRVMIRVVTEASHPLEAAAQLPVGHGGVEGGELDVGHVGVVVDDLVAEGGAGERRRREGVACRAQRRAAPGRGRSWCRRCRRARPRAVSSFSMPCRPPASIAASAR